MMPLADAVPAGASVSRLGAVPGSRGGLVTQAHVARGSPRWRSVLVVGMPTGQGVSTCAQVREARSGRLTAFRIDCLGGTPTARGFEKAGGSPEILQESGVLGGRSDRRRNPRGGMERQKSSVQRIKGHTGCGAAWLARLTGGQEVAGSSPASPTQNTRSAA